MAKLNLNPLSDSVGAEILDFDITNFDAVKFKDIKKYSDRLKEARLNTKLDDQFLNSYWSISGSNIRFVKRPSDSIKLSGGMRT